MLGRSLTVLIDVLIIAHTDAIEAVTRHTEILADGSSKEAKVMRREESRGNECWREDTWSSLSCPQYDQRDCSSYSEKDCSKDCASGMICLKLQMNPVSYTCCTDEAKSLALDTTKPQADSDREKPQVGSKTTGKAARTGSSQKTVAASAKAESSSSKADSSSKAESSAKADSSSRKSDSSSEKSGSSSAKSDSSSTKSDSSSAKSDSSSTKSDSSSAKSDSASSKSESSSKSDSKASNSEDAEDTLSALEKKKHEAEDEIRRLEAQRERLAAEADAEQARAEAAKAEAAKAEALPHQEPIQPNEPKDLPFAGGRPFEAQIFGNKVKDDESALAQLAG
ncbi:unnamed protein product [Effrenium voratum]|uniref:Uncharacterized protein n=1 Tax=Effrenium voratum TaxID=2562239 RepID=A0AA36N744_9DINO|nr:unnamed protein product [Effrenium voratum]CAJ1417722.1 unnamed protein product [Effrenium voratum]